jgi:hypothetical protein
MSELRPDIADAKQKMRVSIGSGREVKKLVEHLWEGEYVEAMTKGAYGRGTGLVVLTDRRLLFIFEGLMGSSSEDFPLDRISSVQWSSGVVLGKIIVFASGNKAEIKNVNKDDGKEITDRIRHRLSAPLPVAPPGASLAPVNTSDVYDQLRRLGELRDSGVLTPQEFETKKAELLRRL